MKIRITKDEDPGNRYTPVLYKAYTKKWWQRKWKYLCSAITLAALEKKIDHQLCLEPIVKETTLKDFTNGTTK